MTQQRCIPNATSERRGGRPSPRRYLTLITHLTGRATMHELILARVDIETLPSLKQRYPAVLPAH